jgi:hypothetical protein
MNTDAKILRNQIQQNIKKKKKLYTMVKWQYPRDTRRAMSIKPSF